MDMERVREWLIQRGIPAEELDQFVEQPVIRDIGDGLMLSLQNDDDIGNLLVEMMMQIDTLETRIATLEAK